MRLSTCESCQSSLFGTQSQVFSGAREGGSSVCLHDCSLTDSVVTGGSCLRAAPPPLSVTRDTPRPGASAGAGAGTRVLAGSGLVSWSCFWHLTWNPPTRDNCCVACHSSLSFTSSSYLKGLSPLHTRSLALNKQAASVQSNRLQNPRHPQSPSIFELATQSRPTSPSRPLSSLSGRCLKPH